MSFLEVTGVSLQERGNDALQNISFTQQQFQKLAIAGETGAGKSTLLQVVAGLVRPDAGQVFFEGELMKDPAEKLIPGNPGIAYLSQQYELPKFLRVEQVLRYANKQSQQDADTLYEVCRISHLAQRQTNQLSGGERQRIALARLLLAAPKLLLLDEPFSNLDIAHKNILKTIIQEVGERLGITCILISHDPHDTLSWADELLIMQRGEIIQRGTPEQIYRQPVSEYAAALFGDYNLLEGPLVAAFAKQAGIRKQNRKMLVRPENFTLAPAGSPGLTGTVIGVRFFGSYSEVEVALRGGSIRLKTAATPVAAQAEVVVALAPESIWYV
ncbi:ABC transporter ATP-binding protein [Hymenobacter taeanensis]|uniref:ABC transporter ATP-binding protein n=1 Tax=Hymenobacter taeanensis TaxID=2735321 RepID=A0A6M6BMA8_9BACT|nr:MULTISPECIES: ABC transporter ATP-binding protein [Hymenobacter]QJX49069.1 ABC transporter ATP-binding protein [Hymenobacter taeanensis]UOQ81410.1 ABC transporter ATP-binding protein [Hymenobacter sp. 5414T-23]